MSTLDLITQKHQRKPEESELAYSDRMTDKAYLQLYTKSVKKKLTKAENEEFTEISKQIDARLWLRRGAVPYTLADKQIKPAIDRLHQELMDEYKGDTPLKRVLIDRITSAWNMAWSYERMFFGTKYQPNEDDTRTSFDFSPNKTRYLKEVRQGIETANDQIIRLTQALQNLCHPPIQVKAKNAFFAQNQQFNQGIPPKDLAKNSQLIDAPSSTH